MERTWLESLTKADLMELARELDVAGRSRMNKAALVAALAGQPDSAPAGPESAERLFRVPGVPREQRLEASARRQALSERLAAMVDTGGRCPWVSFEGHICGLPVVRGSDVCGLHGGGNIYDTAIPLMGRLGFDTWPTLLRQSFLATYDVDPIGLDPIFAEMAWHVLNGLYFDYFRVEVEGIENVPMQGPAMLVANHGGAALPYDGAILNLAVFNEAPKPRRVRVMGTEIFNMLPWVSHVYRKVGAAYAARADADYVLSHGHLLGVFPEGEAGFMKTIRQAYQLQRFGRGGFIDVAERNAAPIVPVAIIGSEEVHPAVTVSKRLARLVRLFFPQQRVDEIAIFLNPIPLPVRWHLRFLPPQEPEEPGVTPDPLRLLERTEDIRRSIQNNLEDMLAKRRSAF